jgi:hypothetical protein
MLPFFIRYYQQFADKIFFYDNESTDNSKKIITSSAKCYYNSYSSNNEIRDDLYLQIKNNAWKQSRSEADFVIVVDMDEFIYSRGNLIKDLAKLKNFGFSIVRPIGYNMLTENFDWNSSAQITEMVNTGMPWKPQSKPCIFNPNLIREINYTFGAHGCKSKGWSMQYKSDGWMNKFMKVELFMLHYKHMGLEYVVNRYKMLQQRLSAFNKENNLGSHYVRTDKEFEHEFNSIRKNMIKIY